MSILTIFLVWTHNLFYLEIPSINLFSLMLLKHSTSNFLQMTWNIFFLDSKHHNWIYFLKIPFDNHRKSFCILMWSHSFHLNWFKRSKPQKSNDDLHIAIAWMTTNDLVSLDTLWARRSESKPCLTFVSSNDCHHDK